MKPNMGSKDRMIRLVLAAALLILHFTGMITGTLGWVTLIVAAIFILTSFVRFCPIYTLVGANTCEK